MTEQEIRERQQAAYDNRDSILPGDILKTKCANTLSVAIPNRYTGTQDTENYLVLHLPSGAFNIEQKPGKYIRIGEDISLRCERQIVLLNAFGFVVDYEFVVSETGAKCTINGPDAQSLVRTVRPVKINNRDIPVLRDVLAVMQSINRTEQLHDWQRGRMVKITASLSGMPGGGERKGLDDAVSLLDELWRDQIRECREYGQLLRRAQRILNTIESRSMRAFVMMRYIVGVSDAEIRRELGMTRRGFSRAVRAVQDAPDMASVKWQERYILEEK